MRSWNGPTAPRVTRESPHDPKLDERQRDACQSPCRPVAHQAWHGMPTDRVCVGSSRGSQRSSWYTAWMSLPNADE